MINRAAMMNHMWKLAARRASEGGSVFVETMA